MTSREKFLAVVDFDTSVPVPDWEFAFWHDTIERWYTEGLPKGNPVIRPEHQFISAEAMGGVVPDVWAYFPFDEGISTVTVSTVPIPAFDRETISEDDEFIEFKDAAGKRVKARKDGRSMPAFLEFPVRSVGDFEEYSRRFDPASKDRFHPKWAGFLKSWSRRTNPLQLGGGNFCGFFSILRELMGLEGALFLFYDDPKLAHRILSFFTEFYIDVYSEVLAQTDVDYVLIWEDMCYKNGPLISPDCFVEFISPCYVRLIDALHHLGAKNAFVDTDGNCEALIPLFMKAGVNGLYPFEAQAGMDIERIRSLYPGLVIMGGVDKMALAAGKDAIDLELKKVRRMLSSGGFIPYTDHAVPPDVDFSNYRYFRRGLRDIISSVAGD